MDPFLDAYSPQPDPNDVTPTSPHTHPAAAAPQTRQILIVTGLSGAGKTSVMRSLEDLGFYCVDNLPVPLLSIFLNLTFHTQTNLLKVALGIDARSEQFLNEFINEIEKLKTQAPLFHLKIIFLNASNQTLLKRFQETRRKHPLAIDIDLTSAIEREKQLLDPIMAQADMVLDTDVFNIHELRNWVRRSFSDTQTREIIVNLISFGFKYGVPAESNLVYDLRFLPNPYFVPELKMLDGRTGDVQNYLFHKEVVIDYWQRLTDFLCYSLQKFCEEGRFFVSVAIGCTGGKHRSVAFVEKLQQQHWPSVRFLVHHRDVGKE